MAVTSTDIITANEVRAVLEERTQAMYQFRRAYRDDDATDINSNTKTFPQATNDLEGDMASDLDEEANYPRSAVEHDGVDANYTKDGFEVAISDEAADDSVINIVLDVTEQMAIAAEAHLDAQAYAVLNANNNATTIGSSGTPLNFDALVDAHVELANSRFNPENFEVYASPFAWGDLAKDDDFNRSTEQGDILARSGQLGTVFGMPIVLTNTGDLGPTEAFIVDTGFYGYESTRWEREVTSYREESKDRDVYKVRVRNDFISTNPDAAVRIVGGTV